MSVPRLKEALDACSDSFAAGDLARSDEAVAGVVGLLDSIAESPPPDAEDVLAEIDRFITSDNSNQMVVDALSLELPKVVIRFVSLSDKCAEMTVKIIDHLVGLCSPRDMLAILCEVLDTQLNMSKAPIYYIHLLDGISKVICRIQRRRVEQLKVALPIILKVIDAVSSDTDETDVISLDDMFRAAYRIGTSIQKVCEELEGRMKQELCAILGLYALQNIALISRSSRTHIVSSCCPHIIEFSNLLRFCGLSYCGLITGSDFDSIAGEVSKVDGDDFMACFSLAIDGASLAVIWGLISSEVADAAGQQLDATLHKLRYDFNKRWLALGMLKYILPCVRYPWEIKVQGIELLLSIMGESDSKESHDSSIDFTSFMPSTFAVIKGLEWMIISAPDASSRKRTFGSLKKVVSNLPSSEKLDMLKALITSSDAPSMMALLIDLVKEEILEEIRQRNSQSVDKNSERKNNNESSSCFSYHALDVVELVLKPPKGGPPPLPEHSEPVLSALNLYRFILILESNGKTNLTGVLSHNMLQKAYTEWLLPLRTLTLAIQAENDRDGDELAGGIVCALAPVQLVLHRCIELVEEKLNHAA